MGRSFEYPKKAQNTVKRYAERGTYELEQIHMIINSSLVLNVAFAPNPEDAFPCILPMIGVMGSFDSPSAGLGESLDCYIHGYVSSRLMRMANNHEKGIPVCVSAIKVDGLVLALTPFNHSYNYRSAVLQGYAKPVDSLDEKLWAMELLTDKVVPSRWANSRTPPDGAELQSTQVLKVSIETGSGKIRHGQPHDDAKDLQVPAVVDKVWTGVVPVYETFGDARPGPDNKVKEIPEYISSYVRTTNETNIEEMEKSLKE